MSTSSMGSLVNDSAFVFPKHVVAAIVALTRVFDAPWLPEQVRRRLWPEVSVRASAESERASSPGRAGKRPAFFDTRRASAEKPRHRRTK